MLPKQSEDEAPCYIALLTDFVHADAQPSLMRSLIDQLDWQQRKIQLFGRRINQPRLVCGYGSKPYRYSGLTIDANEPPNVLAQMLAAVSKHTATAFNSVLGNYYRNGDDYMGWHQDNEAVLGKDPTIASLTLGQRRKFVFKHKTTAAKQELWLESGSLLVMAGSIQHYWMHALPKTKRAHSLRLNFTFRQIR
jgi:alkylated DNA repair dioxygenase AlkB